MVGLLVVGCLLWRGVFYLDSCLSLRCAFVTCVGLGVLFCGCGCLLFGCGFFVLGVWGWWLLFERLLVLVVSECWVCLCVWFYFMVLLEFIVFVSMVMHLLPVVVGLLVLVVFGVLVAFGVLVGFETGVVWGFILFCFWVLVGLGGFGYWDCFGWVLGDWWVCLLILWFVVGWF